MTQQRLWKAWKSTVAAATLAMACASTWWLVQSGGMSSHAVAVAPPYAADTYGVFAEPLVAFSPYTAEQKQALQQAVLAYRHTASSGLVTPLLRYLQVHPDSPWRASILANLALRHDREGYIGKSLAYWQQAEKAMPKPATASQRALADLVVGEQLRLHARLGHRLELKALLARNEGRALSGSASESLRQARGTLWEIENTPTSVLRCGLVALHEVLAGRKASGTVLSRLQKTPAQPYGSSLTDLGVIAAREGQPMLMVYRKPGQDVPVPSVVHWKQGHFAAVIAQQGRRFHIRDSALGRDAWVDRDVLDQESSGYFLATTADPIWRKVSPHEGRSVMGAGPTTSVNTAATSLGDSTDCGNGHGAGSSSDMADATDDGGSCPTIGMPTYQVQSLLVSLSIRDLPLDYTPPKGPDVSFLLSYSQAEAYQPANFSYSNIGQKWTHNWLSYIQDDPAEIGANVSLYKRGGGVSPYNNGYIAENGVYTITGLDKDLLVLMSTDPVLYERRLIDGSKEIFAQSDGAAMAPRKIFLSQVVDRYGNKVSLGYDSQQRLTTITDAAGQQSTMAYQTANPRLITRITDPFGRYTQLGYDASGRLQSITDAIGMNSTFAYASTGNDMTSMTTPYGTTRFSYGGSGIQRWIEITDPINNKERVEFAHTAPNTPYSDTVAPTGAENNQYLNYRNTFYWDKTVMKVAAGDYTKARIKHWLHMSDGFNTTSPVLESIKFPLESRIWRYYPYQPHPLMVGYSWRPSRIARVLDDGTTQATTYDYIFAGNLTRSVDPLGRTTFYDYPTDIYNLAKVRQVSGAISEVVAEYTYNAQRLPLTYKDAAGRVTSYAYNEAGQVTSVTNPKNEVTQYQYNDHGYLTTILNANGKTQASFTYDAAGRLATRTDSEGYTLAYQYDALNRLVKTTYPDGTTQQTTWNKLDKASYTNRLGQVTTYAYDATRNLTAVTDPLNQTTRYGYYENGQLKTLTDARGNSTTWNRDIEGRVISKAYSDGRVYSYAYDSADRLKARTDPLGQVRQTTYTSDNLVMGYSYANALNTTAAVSFTYESLYPRVGTMQDGTGTTSYFYKAAGSDGAGSLDHEVGPDGSMATVQLGYDELGRPVSRSVGADSESYSYDPLGRLLQHQSALGAFAYQYLGETGQVSVERLTGKTWQSVFTYGDNLHDRQLQTITHPAASLDFLNGLLQGLLQLLGLAPRPAQVPTVSYTTGPEFRILSRQDNSGTHTYSYDARQRLLSDGSTTYGYDASDNLTGAQGSSAFSQSANPVNQLISRNGVPWIHDANGNVLDDGRNIYAWDAEDRLIKITSKTTAHVSEFRYDGLSRRVAALERANAAAAPTETRYLWCGSQICQARSGSGQLQARYFPQGEAKQASDGLKPSYYARDHLGSVLQVLDTAGALTGEQRYSDYGNLTYSSGVAPAFGFAGMLQHGQSGLDLTWYRAYDPSSGRWMSRDPIEERGGLNLYGYVGGNPVNWIDIHGLYHYTPTAGAPVDATTGGVLTCMDNCVGVRHPNSSALADLTVTGAMEGGHSPGSAHGTGQACDIGKNSNPGLTREDVQVCYAQCATRKSYGQEEGNHFHIQTRPGRGGATGFAPGVR